MKAHSILNLKNPYSIPNLKLRLTQLIENAPIVFKHILIIFASYLGKHPFQLYKFISEILRSSVHQNFEINSHDATVLLQHKQVFLFIGCLSDWTKTEVAALNCSIRVGLNRVRFRSILI